MHALRRWALCAGLLAAVAAGSPRVWNASEPAEREAVGGGSPEEQPKEQPGEQPEKSPAQTPSTDPLALGAQSPVPDSALRRAAIDSLERGLAYLALRQAEQDDGSLPMARQKENVPIATTALASLAWMASGSGVERGPHGDSIARATDYLLRHVDLDDTSLSQGYVSAPNAVGKMHAHGFATLALAESFVNTPSSLRGRRTSEALVAAVRLIEITQGVEGGWWYDPRRLVEHENSITICLVQALRAAHGAGVEVDPRVIARAIDYVKRTQNEDGSFRYGLDHELATVGITAAAISTLNSTGEYASKEISNGVEWIWRELDRRQEARANTRFAYYERLYLAQALWQNSDPRLFERWYESELPKILTSQGEDGSWIDGTYGPCYATAMNCLVLAIPMGFLPIFQR